MKVDAIIQIIKDLGFPVVVCAYMIYRLDGFITTLLKMAEQNVNANAQILNQVNNMSQVLEKFCRP